MFLDWLSTRVWIHENWRASIRAKLNHCQRAKKWWTGRVISIIAENKPHAHYETYFHLIKIYNSWLVSLTIEVLLIRIFRFFDHWTIHLFQSNQLFQSIDSWTDLFRESSTSFPLKFPKLFHKTCMALWICHPSRHYFYPQFPQSPLGTPGTMTPSGEHTPKKKGRRRKKHLHCLSLSRF